MHNQDLKYHSGHIFGALFIGLSIAVVSELGLLSNLQTTFSNQATQLASPLTSSLQSLDGFTQIVTNMQQLQLANLELQDKLAAANSRLLDQEHIAAENEVLRDQFALQPNIPVNSNLLEVLKYEFTPSVGYLYIKASPGVAVGDAVIIYRYIVGEVVDVSDELARVRLIWAAGTSIPVSIGDSGAVGVLTGSAGTASQLTELDSKASIQEGDLVRLLNPVNPELKNFIFGQIDAVQGDLASPNRTATVYTPLDLYALTHVFLANNH